ncbi:MAG: ribosome biogenesis GTP-binding protein YihA/YsxC [Nibricoccus sp.]
MKIKSAEFDRSASGLNSCPNWNRPEFALIGRSNVGKSSLINMLVERRNLALVSGTPGKTKLLNFFVVNGSWCLVDLPGYGYAKTLQTRRADFNEAVADYLEKRPNLRCTFVLIDSNVPPQQIDLDFVKWIGDIGAPFVLVFTKADKQSVNAAKNNVAAFMKVLATWWPELPGTILCSAKTAAGRSEILGVIEESIAGGGTRLW